jgi:hypothetical protein
LHEGPEKEIAKEVKNLVAGRFANSLPVKPEFEGLRGEERARQFVIEMRLREGLPV